ncbi:MAG: TOTE conflict system archaeo-eukaryotic primase domain-containing protein [Acidimicrobiales bacterium]
MACDFDGPGWVLDARAYVDAARSAGIDPALERSRSGNGAHVWMFFATPVPAASARRIGVGLLREAMTVRAEIDLGSYDRLFPSQDFIPRGSFGNLIALPLQRNCRTRGTTVFLDPTSLGPFEDQWAFLAHLKRLSRESVDALAKAFGDLATGPDALTYRRPAGDQATAKPPAQIRAVAGAKLLSIGSGSRPRYSRRSSTWRRCTTPSSTRRRSCASRHVPAVTFEHARCARSPSVGGWD